MGIRVLVEEGDVRRAIGRLKSILYEEGVYDELYVHRYFESHRARRRLKRSLARERYLTWLGWERLGLVLTGDGQDRNEI